MMKLFLQALALVALFLATWFGLRQINWMDLLHVQQAKERTEEKLGELYWKMISMSEKENTRPELIQPVDSLLRRICRANDIDRQTIHLHLLDKDEVNAFALPDNHLIVFSGLIRDCDSAEELCGVLGHELAHMTEGHIMRKLVREIGLSVLISMTSGGASPEIIQQAIKLLSSSAYDRNLEREADLMGADFLVKANIDPEPFANFLFRLSEQEKSIPDQFFWISSHPGSEDRAKDILASVRGVETAFTPAMDSTSWHQLKAALEDVY